MVSKICSHVVEISVWDVDRKSILWSNGTAVYSQAVLSRNAVRVCFASAAIAPAGIFRLPWFLRFIIHHSSRPPFHQKIATGKDTGNGGQAVSLSECTSYPGLSLHCGNSFESLAITDCSMLLIIINPIRWGDIYKYLLHCCHTT